jgi:hypothetical protein
MFKQIIAQSLNGFSIKDIPFLLLQISVSSILVIIIRIYWRKTIKDEIEKYFLTYLVPFQIALTTLSVFSIKSPWVVVLFGLISLIPVLGGNSLSLKSKFFYLLCVFIAFGCGSVNLAVTSLVTLLLIIPLLHFKKLN